MDLENKRIMVTGGSGFLGRYLARKLYPEGCENVFVPRNAQYDLRKQIAVAQAFDDIKPDIIIHLATVVSGIGTSRERPGEFFYDNLTMGTQLMETARLNSVEKFVGISTICSYPKFAPIPFREDDIWSGYPEETDGQPRWKLDVSRAEKEFGFSAKSDFCTGLRQVIEWHQAKRTLAPA